LPSAAPFQALFDKRIAGFGTMYAIFDRTASEETKQAFFARSQTAYETARKFVLETLPTAIHEGPFIAGASPGEDDFHVGAWLFRVARSGGASKGSEGIAALEKWFGEPVSDKVKTLWNEWVKRESWKTVYPDDTLH